MSSKPAREVAERFQRKLGKLDATRKRVERAFERGSLRLSDAESTYAGLFLQGIVAYENAIEDFVLGLLVRPGGLKSGVSNIKGRVTVRSYAHALQLASGPGAKYPSWIKREDLTDISKLLLNNGGPFTSLPTQPVNTWHYVNQCAYIRNAIAHPSKYAQEKFLKHVVQATPLPRRERTVAGYLRGEASVGITRWEVCMAGLKDFIVVAVA